MKKARHCQNAGLLDVSLVRQAESVALNRDDIDASTFLVERNFAVAQSEQRVVPTSPDVAAGMPFGATLASQNVACKDGFPAKFLDASPLRVGIASVAAGTLSLLMSHYCKLQLFLISECIEN